MKLTIIGCLGGFPHQDQGTTCFLLQAKGYNLLIDCGSCAVTKLEHFVSPLCLDSVILSHYHYDHIADLGVLQQYRQLWPKDDPKWDQKILKIWGIAEDEANFAKLTMPNVSLGKPLKETDVKKIGPWEVTFLKTVHPVVCFAMRFVERETGKVLVFTGDTGYFPELNNFAQNADLFIADTYFFAGLEHHPAHLTAPEAGTIAQEAQVKKLILTHLPQFGDLEELKQQAQDAAGTAIEVILAQERLMVEI